jgi:hypothetical protein
MPERAHVTSIDALEAFRSTLIIYLTKARPTLDEVGAEVVRTRSWLEDEQRNHWDNELRRRTRALEEAQAALFSARLSSFREASSVEQMAVHRAKRAFDEAQDKLRVIKKWSRDFDNRVDPLLKQTEKLQTVLAHDMVQAIAFLTQAINSLHAYAGVALPSAAPPSGQPGSGSPAGGAGAGDQGVAGPDVPRAGSD